MIEKYIAFIRVSTGKQGDSRIGIEKQQMDISAYVKKVGGIIIREIIEVGSGGDKGISINKQLTLELILSRRPPLDEAIDLAEKENAIIVFKNSERFTRFSLLMDFVLLSDINIIATDYPFASPQMLRDKTYWAEQERLAISQRSLDAHEIIRKRGYTRSGKPVGNPYFLTAGANISYKELDELEKKDGGVEYVKKILTKPIHFSGAGQVKKERAANNPNTIRAIATIKYIQEVHPEWNSDKIAEHLNKNKFMTSSNKKFNGSAVRSLATRDARWKKQEEYKKCRDAQSLEMFEAFLERYPGKSGYSKLTKAWIQKLIHQEFVNNRTA